MTGGCDTSGCTDEVQILDVSGSGQTCMDAPSFPYEVSEAMSFNINGYPWICGGTGVNGTGVRMVTNTILQHENVFIDSQISSSWYAS